MAGVRHQRDKQNDSTISTLQIPGEAGGLPNMERWVILYTPDTQEGTRVRIRAMAEEAITGKAVRPEAKQVVLFVETSNTVPVGTIVKLAISAATGAAEQQSIEASVSFVCPIPDQFGYSPGLGIRVIESPHSH